MTTSRMALITLAVGAVVWRGLLAPVAWAAPYAVGSTVPRLTVEDQHDKSAILDEQLRVLVVTRDMDAGDVVKKALADIDQPFLDARRAAYLADISRMPALISKMIAVPRMRQRGYRVLLDRDGSLTRDVPQLAGKPTVVFLDALRVTRIEHPATAEELRAMLDPPR